MKEYFGKLTEKHYAEYYFRYLRKAIDTLVVIDSIINVQDISNDERIIRVKKTLAEFKRKHRGVIEF